VSKIGVGKNDEVILQLVAEEFMFVAGWQGVRGQPVGDGDDLAHTGFKSFVEMLDTYSPKYFFHGHQHLNYGRHSRILQYKSTTIVNAYGYYLMDCEF